MKRWYFSLFFLRKSHMLTVRNGNTGRHVIQLYIQSHPLLLQGGNHQFVFILSQASRAYTSVSMEG